MPAAPALTPSRLGHSLPLPVVGPDIPAAYNFRRNSRMLANLAEGLYKAGVLGEEHWTGDIASSVGAGLNDFLNFQMGLADLKNLHGLSFFYTDNLEDESVQECEENNLWIQSGHLYHEFGLKYAPGFPLGGFGFACDGYDVVEVGEGVERLERMAPGAGYTVLEVVDAALRATVDGLTPQAGKRMLQFFGGWDYKPKVKVCIGGEAPPDNENLEDWEVSLYQIDSSLYYKSVPQKATEARFRRRPLLRLLEENACSDYDQEAIACALDLAALLRTAWHGKTLCNHRYLCHVDSTMPVCVRWSDKDPLQRIFDAYHDLLQNEGESTQMAFLSAFALHKRGQGEGTLAWAIRNLRKTCLVLHSVDRLLAYLRAPSLTRTLCEEPRAGVGGTHFTDPYMAQARLEEREELRLLEAEAEEEEEAL